MANRCYLYSTNFLPGRDVTGGDRRVVGIAEWSWDIPLVFKLLLSGDPRKCRSLIWDVPEEVAVVGNYDVGVANLLAFLERISHPAAPALKEEAEEFLAAEKNKNPYFLLEGSEIFDIGDASPAESPAQQNDLLLAEIKDLGPAMEKAIAELDARVHEETHPPGFFARFFGARTPMRKDDSSDLIYNLGLGGWTNVLFYDPNRS
jgi:hypothetical protein